MIVPLHVECPHAILNVTESIVSLAEPIETKDKIIRIIGRTLTGWRNRLHNVNIQLTGLHSPTALRKPYFTNNYRA
jgi:hypothetical protein